MKTTQLRFHIKYLLIGITIGIIACLLLSSCKQIQYVPVESVRTIKETETIRDTTIIVKIEQSHSENTTKGDSSYLKNKYAHSYAWWDGKLLHHNLGTFDTGIPVKVFYLDRWHFTNDTIRVPMEVEKQLSRWEKIKMDVGGWAIGVLSGLAIIIIIYFGIRMKK